MIIGGSRYFAKVLSEHQPIPLKIHFEFKKGPGIARIYISQTNDRPSRSNCEKGADLQKRDSVIMFHGNMKQEMFTKDCIFLSIESDKDVFMSLTCSFGKCIVVDYICDSNVES